MRWWRRKVSNRRIANKGMEDLDGGGGGHKLSLRKEESSGTVAAVSGK